MRILAALDLSESTDKIISSTERLARALSAELWLLHVAEPEPDFIGLEVGPQSVREAVSKAYHREHAHIQKLAEALRAKALQVTALLVQGTTAATILSESEKLNVDLIVVGSHGHGAVFQMLVGSVSEAVLQKSSRPVLVIPTHNR